MNKKIIISVLGILAVAFTAIVTFKSIEGLEQLDLSDPFEVDFEEE